MEANVDSADVDDGAEAFDGAAEGTAVGACDEGEEWSSLGGTGGAGLPGDNDGTVTAGILGGDLKVFVVGTSVLETAFRLSKSWNRVPRMGS